MPLGAPDYVKNPPFEPPEKLLKLGVQNPWVFQRGITPAFLVRFWLAASQNDRTGCPLKMDTLETLKSKDKSDIIHERSNL